MWWLSYKYPESKGVEFPAPPQQNHAVVEAWTK